MQETLKTIFTSFSMVFGSNIHQLLLHVNTFTKKNTSMRVGPVLPHVSLFNLLIMDD